jgi:hypothetical protein
LIGSSCIVSLLILGSIVERKRSQISRRKLTDEY